MAAASIVVDLLMKTGSFETDTKRAEKALANFEKTSINVAKKVVTGFAAAAAAIATSVKLSINAFDELSKSSQKIGVSVEALSGLKFAADLSGVSFENLQVGLAKLSVNIDKFNTGTKTAVETFNRLQLDPSRFTSTEETLSAIADRFAELPDGATKTALAIEVFGKSGRDLIPLLNQGSAGIKSLTDEAAKLGLVIDTNTARAAEKFNDDLKRLTSVATGFRNQVAVELLPVLTDLADAFATVTKETINLRSQGGESVGGDIAVGFARLVDVLIVIPKIITTIASSFKVVLADINTILAGVNAINPFVLLNPSRQVLKEFETALSERNKVLQDANNAYERLWNEPANRFEQAVLTNINFRTEYIQKYTEIALQVQRAYINESVEIQRQAQLELAKNLGFNVSTTGSFELPEANPAAEAAGKAREAAAKKIESYIDSLKREAATLGFNAEQIKRYEAAQLNLNATQRIAVDALIGKIEAYKEEEQRLKALDEALKEHDEILKRSADLELETLQEVQQEQEAFANTISSYVDSVERAIDPTIELADNIGRLQSALSLGLIDSEQFNRLEEFIQKTYDKSQQVTDEITEFWIQAARNMQSAMSDLFFDAMQGKLGDLATSFKRTIDRMVSELIASQLLNFLTGDFGRTGQLGGIVGDLFGGIVGRYTGGPVTQNSPYLVGERGPELFVPSTSGRVIDANTTRSMGGGVTVQNNFTIQGTMDTRTQAQISSMVGMSVNRAMARNT
jgi:hypothetical protein